MQTGKMSAMREKYAVLFKGFLTWIGGNISWEILSWIIKFLFSFISGKLIVDRLPGVVIERAGELLSNVGIHTLDYLVVLVVISGFVYGAVSFFAPPTKWLIRYVLRTEKPHLVQDNEWNAIIDYATEKVVVAVISIKNQPGRRTDKSVAYSVSACIDYFDKEDRHLVRVKCGFWNKESPQSYFSEAGNKRRHCKKIDFYTHDTWYLPLVYQVGNDETVYAYDHGTAIKSKRIGKLPIKASIVFDGENLKPIEPLRYWLIPNTTGTHPRGFWVQKR